MTHAPHLAWSRSQPAADNGYTQAVGSDELAAYSYVESGSKVSERLELYSVANGWRLWGTSTFTDLDCVLNGGRTLLVRTDKRTGNQIRVVNAVTGAAVWKASFPTTASDVLLPEAECLPNNVVAEFDPAGADGSTGFGRVTARSTVTGKLLWQATATAGSGYTLGARTVYGRSSTRLTAYNALDGTQTGSVAVPAEGYVQYVGTSDLIVTRTGSTSTATVRNAVTLRPAWSGHLPSNGQFSIAGNELIVTAGSRASAYSAATGRLLWSDLVPSRINGVGFDVTGGLVYAYSWPGDDFGKAVRVAALAVKTGKQQWVRTLPDRDGNTEIVPAAGAVYVHTGADNVGPGHSGAVYALRASTGRSLWEYRFLDWPNTSNLKCYRPNMIAFPQKVLIPYRCGLGMLS